MATVAKIENIQDITTTTSSSSKPRMSETSSSLFSQISTSTLTQLCQRLRVQLIQQRLPIICPACRPSLILAFKMELNLTQMIRGLCKTCKELFMSVSLNEDVSMTAKRPGFEQKIIKGPTTTTTTITTETTKATTTTTVTALPVAAKIKKVILKLSEPNFTITSQKDHLIGLPIFEVLTSLGRNWCRYCGSTKGVSWRPGPWGPRTLCNRHGRAFNGYGHPERIPRLDLSLYLNESVEQRKLPVLQEVCTLCRSYDGSIVPCSGCPNAFHVSCHRDLEMPIKNSENIQSTWFCSKACKDCLDDACSGRVETVQVTGLASPTNKQQQRQQQRYAKRFDSTSNVPLTPPPTPTPTSKPGRKRRATGNSVSDVLVCFESDFVIKRPSLDKQIVYTPAYKLTFFPPNKQLTFEKNNSTIAEIIHEEALIQRHGRYEEVEKTMRLCRPDVLRSLYTNSPVSSDNSFDENSIK